MLAKDKAETLGVEFCSEAKGAEAGLDCCTTIVDAAASIGAGLFGSADAASVVVVVSVDGVAGG
ncbi:MAG: hypothetical protein JST78_06475 [Bacteroidetes bacterium]|nr:hypothetical protein [Bacteroidota bacterium]